MENKKCEKCGNEYSGELAACPHCETTKPVGGGAPVEKKKSGLGTASMVLGIISIAIAWIPLLNYACFILGVLAVVFAIICFVKKASKGKAIAGIICGGISLFIPIIYTLGFIGAVDDALDNNPFDYDYDYDYDDEDWDFDLDDEPSVTYYSVGDTFAFDDFEVVVGQYEMTSYIDNQYSSYYGKDLIRIPLTIKNIGDQSDHISEYDMKVFGPAGTETDEANYLYDDSMSLPGDLRPDASYTKYYYAVYEDNGTYTVEFEGFLTDDVIVEFDVTK